MHRKRSLRRWLAIGLATLAALVVIPLTVGFFLPERHVASSAITLAQPADSVWLVVRTFEEYPSWWPVARRMERRDSDDGREIWAQYDDHDAMLPMEVVRVEPPEQLVTRILSDGLPFGGTWTYDVRQIIGGTRVTITENGEVYNPVFRFVARVFLGHHATMDSYLRALAQRFGEDLEPTHLD